MFFLQKIQNNGKFQKCWKKRNVAYIEMTNQTTQKYLGIRTVLSPDSVLNLNVRFSAHDHRSAPHTKNTLERCKTL